MSANQVEPLKLSFFEKVWNAICSKIPSSHDLQSNLELNFPKEILNVIFYNLTILDLNNMQYVSKKFYQTLNEPLFWIVFANQQGVTLSKKISPKKELILKQTLELPERALHAYVAKIIGLEAFDKLPIIQYSKNRHICAPIMKGIDSMNRTIIALRYVNRLDSNPLQRKVALIIPLDIACPNVWSLDDGYNTEDLFQRLTIFNKNAIDRLERLLKHEPCGGVKEYNPQAPRTLPSGESIFELV